jgi:predicted transcriptional regulator
VRGAAHQPRDRVILVWAARSDGDTQMRPKIGPAIVERFGNGRWHSLGSIAQAMNTSKDHVYNALKNMTIYGTHGAKSERKQVGATYSYRIFKQEKMISSRELVEKLDPVIKGLKAEGKKTAATMSPGTVAHLAAQLQKLLDDWTA